MTFNAREYSLANGQPVRLYQFVRGIQQWTYASGDRDIEHMARVYTSVAGGVSDRGISQGGEASTQKVVLTGPADLAVAQLYRGIPPSDTIDLVIYDRHVGDTEYRVSWVGEILGVSFPAADRSEITCRSESESIDGQGLHLTWDRACPHCLYERGCNVERDLYKVSGTIISLNPTTITASAVSGYPAGWFNSGYIEWPVGMGNYDRRAIESHSGGELILFGGTDGLSLNQDFFAYAGCDQTPATCNTKFNNLPNCGGNQYLPGRSPFDGDPVF